MAFAYRNPPVPFHRRRVTSPVGNCDIREIVAKIQIVEALNQWGIDYDRYRSGFLPSYVTEHIESISKATGHVVDVSPCDFHEFHLYMLKEFTADRDDTTLAPQYYHVKPKEEARFVRYMKEVFPEHLDQVAQEGSRRSQQTKDFLRLNYETCFKKFT